MEMFGSRLSAMTVVLIEARKAITWNDWDNSELFQHFGAETWYCDLLVLRPHSVLTILNSLPSHPSTRFGKLQCFGINVLLLGQCNLLISIVSFHFASLNMQETHTSLMVPYSETVHLGDNIASETISPSGARCLAG